MSWTNQAAVKRVTFLAAIWGLAASAQAVETTWVGGGSDNNWSTTENWSVGVPANSDTLRFGGETRTNNSNDLTNLLVGLGTTASNTAITFSNNGTAGQTGQFTLSGNLLRLGGNITATGVSSGSLKDTIALNMQINATRTIAAASNHSIEVSGVISDDTATRLLITTAPTTGTGKVILSGLNTFAGIRMNGGTTVMNTLLNAGVASSPGLGAAIQIGAGTTDTTLEYTGGATSTDRRIFGFNHATQNHGSRIDNNGSGALTFTAGTLNDELPLVASTRTLTLGGSSNGVIEGIIRNNNSAAGVLALTKADTGSWTLSGSNTYSGATAVNAGSLFVNGNQSAATGAVTVAAIATLGGTGTLGGATAISGILAPGSGGIGTLAVANDVTWNGAANWLFELGAAGASIGSPGTADQLSISGGNFLKGIGPSWAFDFAGSGDVGWYKLADWTGTTSFLAGDFTATNLSGVNTGTFVIADSALYIQIVPEPGTWPLAGLGMAVAAGLAVRRRRRGLAAY